MGRKSAQQPNAPYIPKGWMQNFFQLIKRVRLQNMNRTIAKQYALTAPGNESKLVASLRFLKIIDNDGLIDDNKINSLKMEGQQFKSALDKIIRDAYAEVFQTLDVERATRSDLKNFFTGKYNFSQIQSNGAIVLFAFLCELADIKISPEIADMNKQKIRFGSERKTEKKSSPPKNEGFSSTTMPSHHNQPFTAVPEEDSYVVIVRGKDFSLNRTLKNKEDMELLIQTLKINCKFK
jgi:hypothetical protein